MKKYEYVNVEMISKFVGAKSESHRSIIDEYAQKGYKYVGFIPTDIAEYGKIKKRHSLDGQCCTYGRNRDSAGKYASGHDSASDY